MTLLGEVSLWGALLMAAWTVIVSFGGGMLRRPDLIRSGERATYTTACFTLLAVAGVETGPTGRPGSPAVDRTVAEVAA